MAATGSEGSASAPGTVAFSSGMNPPSHPPDVPPKARRPSTRSTTRIVFDCLGHGPVRQVDMRGRRYRAPFLLSPSEREINRVSKAGRPLSELEILQEKHESEFRQIVPVVADCLSACLEQHEELAKNVQRDARYAQYETNCVPGIQIEDYVHRIAEYTYISPATLVGAMIFLDRLCLRHGNLLLTNLNIFKLFFVAVRVASKVVDLRTLNNKNFASVGGISNRHLNDLEAKFLIDIRFDLYVQPREFSLYAQRIMSQLPSAHVSSVPRPLPSIGADDVDSH